MKNAQGLGLRVIFWILNLCQVHPPRPLNMCVCLSGRMYLLAFRPSIGL